MGNARYIRRKRLITNTNATIAKRRLQKHHKQLVIRIYGVTAPGVLVRKSTSRCPTLL